MNEPWPQVLFLGIVQGATEFLPISSSGHLTLMQYLMGFQEPHLLLDVVLHGGTLGALMLVFRRDIIQILRGFFENASHESAAFQPSPGKVLIYIALGTLVTGIVGLGLHDFIEMLYAGINTVGPCWIFTGAILWKTSGAPRGQPRIMGPWDAILVGLAQALALAPGISRSGMTIAVGLLLRWDRRWAATFSFLLSIPATLGAVFLEVTRGEVLSATWSVLVLGGITSLIVGWVSLRWLINLVLKGHLYRFAYYCWAIGVVAVLLWVLS